MRLKARFFLYTLSTILLYLVLHAEVDKQPTSVPETDQATSDFTIPKKPSFNDEFLFQKESYIGLDRGEVYELIGGPTGASSCSVARFLEEDEMETFPGDAIQYFAGSDQAFVELELCLVEDKVVREKWTQGYMTPDETYHREEHYLNFNSLEKSLGEDPRLMEGTPSPKIEV